MKLNRRSTVMLGMPIIVNVRATPEAPKYTTCLVLQVQRGDFGCWWNPADADCVGRPTPVTKNKHPKP